MRRHGSPEDRGSADRYYGRSRSPHYYKGDSYMSPRVGESEMTPEEIADYNKGYDEEWDAKDWD